MPSVENPFPGMNPYLERRWKNAHTLLIANITEVLSEKLPVDLSVLAEEEIVVQPLGEPGARYQADVGVVEDWKKGIAPSWNPIEANQSGGEVIIAEPELIGSKFTETQRWVEIRDRGEKLITVIEILSPSNKCSPNQAAYVKKQNDLMEAGVNLVEIDLIRSGTYTVAAPEKFMPKKHGTHSIICVARSPKFDPSEVYRIALAEPIPAFNVPLRVGEPDVPLSLQPLIDRCYKTGRYWHLDYSIPLTPQFPEDEAEWISGKLESAELIGKADSE